MKSLLMAAAVLAAAGASEAKAKCTPISPIGNIQPFQCDSDNQATDKDDVKFFLAKSPSGGVVSEDGSLIKNSSQQKFLNIIVSGNTPFESDGNGFANIKGVLRNSPDNPLRDVTFFPFAGSFLDDGKDTPFLGFDGFFGRGQVDATGPVVDGKRTWDGDVFMDVVFTGGAKETLEFTGDTKQDDFGAIGFDEINEPGAFIQSVSMRLDSTGAFNELKQFDFSVTGQVGSVPEPQTWVMLGVGFAMMAAFGWRRNRRAAFAA